MIDRQHFGKRIAHLRHTAGLSQVQLAEKLGVTPQAVSRWECGGALPDIEMLLELSRLYGTTVNMLLEGHSLLAELTGRQPDADGITYFAPRQEATYNAAWAAEIVSGGWVHRNWQAAQKPNEVADRIGQSIAAHGGRILELGAGPGGGFMPYILKADPNAVVIVNDLSPTVVQQWKLQLDKTLHTPNIHYSVFNFCTMPLPDGCMDVISDGGGIGNCEQGSRAAALREAYRVLRPGGVLVTSTGFVTRDSLAALPTEVQKELLMRRPDLFEDLYEDAVLAGFAQIDSRITGGWDTDGDDSAAADLAQSLGVNLHFTGYVRYCYKR